MNVIKVDAQILICLIQCDMDQWREPSACKHSPSMPQQHQTNISSHKLIGFFIFTRCQGKREIQCTCSILCIGVTTQILHTTMYKTAYQTTPELLIFLVEVIEFSEKSVSNVDKLELSLQINFCYSSLILSVVILSQFDALTNIDSMMNEWVVSVLAKISQKLCILWT